MYRYTYVTGTGSHFTPRRLSQWDADSLMANGRAAALCALVAIMVYCTVPISAAASLQLALEGPSPGSHWGDGCLHVFLDVGANIGVQTRKLFEPQAYPLAGTRTPGHSFSWTGAFDSMLGENRQQHTCSFAFEANVHHSPRLRSLETCYKARGWRAKIFTETAAAAINSTLPFYDDPVNIRRQEWAASLLQHGRSWRKQTAHEVAAIDLAWWIRYHILERRIPSSSAPTSPTVLMKLDVEAAEFDIVGRMLDMGLVCGPRDRSINLLALEWHRQFVEQKEGRPMPCDALPKCRAAAALMNRVGKKLRSPTCSTTRYVEEDDDSFMYDSKLALPIFNESGCRARA